MIADISLRKQDDAADRAPAQAREKLIDMRYAAKAANLLTRDLGDEIANLRDQKAREEQRLCDLASGRYAAVPKEQIAAQQARVDMLAEKIGKLHRRYDEAREKWESLQRPFQALEVYLRDVSRDSLTMKPELPEPALKKGEIAPDAIARVRGEIDRLQIELRMVETAPFPSVVVKSRMRAQIAALAKAGRPDVMGAIEGGGPIVFQQTHGGVSFVSGLERSGHYVENPSQTDALALFAWMRRDELIAAIEREIDDNADDASALDDVTRAKKKKQFKAQILDQERIEEQLITLAQSHGLMIARRPGADPRAVLGVNGPEPRA